MAIFGMIVIAIAIDLFDGKVTPARHVFDANRDDREAVERHPAILGVARAEQRLRPVVLGAVGEDLGGAAPHDPPEPATKAASGFSVIFRRRFNDLASPFGFWSIVM